MSYIQETDNTKRLVSLGLVTLMHVGLGYAVVTGLGRDIIQQVAPPIIVDIIEDVKPKEDEPPPPPPKIEPQKVFIPPPVIDIASLAPPPPETAMTITREPPPTPAPVQQPTPQPKPVVKVGMGYDPRAARRGDYEPEYPPQAKRLGEEGTVILNVCAGPDGRVESATVVRSSGSSNLDDAAVRHFERRKPKMRPATEDGVGVRACAALPVRFNLKEAR
jgi:periplasmic protein TonB